MRIGEAFPSKYLKAGDLPDGQFVPVTIAHVELQNVAGTDQAEENKPILHFVGTEKGMVLNRTNSQEIANHFGDETDDWSGKRILLYATTTLFQGKTVACLRVKVQKQTVAKTAAPRAPVAAPPQPEYQGEPAGSSIPTDSDIPFGCNKY